ncbi:hypothetical protein LXL04_022369 [Taraxacum kok-saghyz]
MSGHTPNMQNIVFEDRRQLHEVVNNPNFGKTTLTSCYMTRISELSYGCLGGPLELRILRRWTRRFHDAETCFLAVDEHGDVVQLVGSKTSQSFLESKFRLGQCYRVENYTCAVSDKQQQILPCPVFLNVGQASAITELNNNINIPTFWFSFANYAQLYDKIDKEYERPDLIGYFKEARQMEKDTKEKFVRLKYTDESGSLLTVTLWKECISVREKFDPTLLTSMPEDTIVAITNGKAFWVKARISSYDIDNGWFNFSVTLLDSTSEMKVMMTDEAIQSLSQTTCAKIVCEDGEDDRMQLPSLFEEYKTKSFAFQLKLTRRAALIKEHNFIITDVSRRFLANDVAENVEMTPPPVTPTPASASTLSPSSTDERSTAKSTTRKHLSFTKPNKHDESRPPKQRRG